MATAIPRDWCDTVATILELGRAGTRFVTSTARMDWMTLFPEKFSFDLYKVLAEILRLGSYTDARKIDTMSEPGDVYEFLFMYEGRRMYL